MRRRWKFHSFISKILIIHINTRRAIFSCITTILHTEALYWMDDPYTIHIGTRMRQTIASNYLLFALALGIHKTGFGDEHGSGRLAVYCRQINTAKNMNNCQAVESNINEDRKNWIHLNTSIQQRYGDDISIHCANRQLASLWNLKNQLFRWIKTSIESVWVRHLTGDAFFIYCSFDVIYNTAVCSWKMLMCDNYE